MCRICSSLLMASNCAQFRVVPKNHALPAQHMQLGPSQRNSVGMPESTPRLTKLAISKTLCHGHNTVHSTTIAPPKMPMRQGFTQHLLAYHLPTTSRGGGSCTTPDCTVFRIARAAAAACICRTANSRFLRAASANLCSLYRV